MRRCCTVTCVQMLPVQFCISIVSVYVSVGCQHQHQNALALSDAGFDNAFVLTLC